MEECGSSLEHTLPVDEFWEGGGETPPSKFTIDVLLFNMNR
jgi:hypothetical protein